MQGEDRMQKTAGPVLVVGSLGGVFSRSDQPQADEIVQCDNMLDAITMAGSQSFDTVAVVLGILGLDAESALQTLRRVSGGARVVLLARMHEEVAARRLTRNPRRPFNPADAYFICPIAAGEVFADGRGGGTARAGVHTLQADRDIEQILAPASPGRTAVVRAGDDRDRHIRQLEQLATQDDLTGLKNRRYTREFLRQILQHAKQSGLQVTLLLFDIDDFKQYNDRFGHEVGDRVLRQTAVMMQRAFRRHDVVARVGGDEFAVVFWDRPRDDNGRASGVSPAERRRYAAPHPRQALVLSERFCEIMRSSNLSSLGAAGMGQLTISGGLATYPRDGRTPEELFRQADRAMLDVKRTGKNRLSLVGQCD